PPELGCRRQPGTLNGVAVLGVAAPRSRRKHQDQGEHDEDLEQHQNLLQEQVYRPSKPSRAALTRMIWTSFVNAGWAAVRCRSFVRPGSPPRPPGTAAIRPPGTNFLFTASPAAW